MTSRKLSGNHWLLPEGVEEMLPVQAARLEQLRREILDVFDGWGYDLVIPPMIEFLESLLTGTGHDLDLQTFKITDQLTGRMMGVRADITPQVARIDAHRLKEDHPTRLCYVGPVLQTNPKGLSASRNPLLIGAELYGHTGLESDVEIICLMLEVLKGVGLESAYVDLGHTGIYKGLVEQVGLTADQEQILFDILQRKALPELTDRIAEWGLPEKNARMLSGLCELNGEVDTLETASKVLADANDDVLTALSDISKIVEQVQIRIPNANLHIDLAELRGFHYHTGVMFAAYLPGHGQALARGGRYDDIGGVFGRARPATGFSTDLKTLVNTSTIETVKKESILAPWLDDSDLADKVEELRQQGHRVVNALPGQIPGAASRKLEKQDGTWVVK